MAAKTWFITGVSSGLGAAIAAAALARGDRVAGLLRNEAAGQAFEAQAPGRAMACIADVRDREAVFARVAEVEARTDGVDILVNNAGQVLESFIEEVEPDAARTLLDINLLGPLTCIQAVLPFMRARGRGKIFNVSSGGGILGVPSVGFYSATKFALEGLSEALAAEVGGLGIQVTIIEPGAFRTNLLVTSRTTIASKIPDYDRTAGKFRRRIASMGGLEPGDPSRLAQAMLVLADSETPPLRAPLGDDAIGMVRQKIDSILGDLSQWESLGKDLGFPKT